LIPATARWPLVGLLLYVVWRAARRHDEREAAERGSEVSRILPEVGVRRLATN
jgi:hypothetical protein